MKLIENVLQKIARLYGFDIVKYNQDVGLDAKLLPSDFSKDDIATLLAVKPYTMTSPERIFALIQAVQYIVKNNICGDIVECGVWKGAA